MPVYWRTRKLQYGCIHNFMIKINVFNNNFETGRLHHLPVFILGQHGVQSQILSSGYELFILGNKHEITMYLISHESAG